VSHRLYLEEFQAIAELSRKVYDFSEKDYCTYLFNSMHLAGKIQEKVPKRNSTKELEYIVQHALDKKFRNGLNEIPIKKIVVAFIAGLYSLAFSFIDKVVFI